MPIYLELLDDDHLVAMSRAFKSILIVACGACPNESLACKLGIPRTEVIITEEGQRENVPHAITTEVRRIAARLQTQGLAIDTEVLDKAFLCYLSDDECTGLSQRLPTSEAILALCCSAAVEALKRIKGTPAQVLVGMESVALFFYSYSSNPDSGASYIVDFQKHPLPPASLRASDPVFL